jgi:hypothetical protein
VTIHYPDISAYQAGISCAGAPAVSVKATEGTGWANADYIPALARAKTAGTFGFAYHFLRQGAAAAQAAWCHSHVGPTGLMLDFEPIPQIGSRPTLGDACEFIDAFGRLGGTGHLTYLPRWYWQELGSPSLAPLASRGQHLVSSNYGPYSDDPAAAGWQPYGGMTPAVWQHSSSWPWHGQQVDENAWRGTVDQLRALVGGAAPPQPPAPADGPTFPYPAGHYLGQPSQSPFWAVVADGQFGASSEAAARAFQAEKGLGSDGKAGVSTWRAAWTAQVTP